MKEDELLSPQRVTFEVDRLKRSYFVHLPKHYDEAQEWPVVLMFHGGGTTAKSAMEDTGWEAKADREGFIAVFPEGTSPEPSRPSRFLRNPQTWNDGSRQSAVGAAERGISDISFVSAMIDDLKKRYQVDHRRVYATGFSNGASMAFLTARELSMQVAAIAPVAGHDWSDKEPSRPVPLIYFVGAVDPLCPIEGGEVFFGRTLFGETPGIREMLLNWGRLHGSIDQLRELYNKDGAVGKTFSQPGEVETIVLYIIDDHGHHWPGGKTLLGERIAGKNTARLKATDVIWEFFKMHSIPPE